MTTNDDHRLFSLSSFTPDAESTRLDLDGFADDSTPNIKLRSTVERQRHAYYYRPPLKHTPSTSTVRKTFKDVDFDGVWRSPDDEQDLDNSALHERPRGFTPPPASPAITVNMGSNGHDSLYDITHTPTASFLQAARERLSKSNKQDDVDAVTERLTRVSPAKSNTSETRRTRFANYKKLSAMDETNTSTDLELAARQSPRRSRFSSARAATSPVSAAATFSKPSPRNSFVASTTPQPARPSTPKGTAAEGNTKQSFGLPDLPNLTELMSGMYKDGTPIFARSAKARSRFDTRTVSLGHHIPVENVPVPEDEKAIFASLQLMKEKVAQLEQERAEADKRIQEQENELVDLRVKLDAQVRMRRSDSGFGSGGDEVEKRRQLRKENLEGLAALDATQKKLGAAQRKLEVNDIALKRVTKERDTAVAQLGSAFYNSEELKTEQDALQKENAHLRDEVDTVRAENDELRSHHTQCIENATVRGVENERLRVQLTDLKHQHGGDTQRIQFQEADARRRAEEKAQRQQLQLQQEKAEIESRLSAALAKHEKDAREWQAKQLTMQSQIEELEETTQQIQTANLSQIAEDTRIENEKLKKKLAQQQQPANEGAEKKGLANKLRELEEAKAFHEEDSLMWSRREAQLTEEIARLKTRKSILEKRPANTASQRVEKFAGMPKIAPGLVKARSVRPDAVKTRAASARLVRTSDDESEEHPFMFGGLPASTAKHIRRVSAPNITSDHRQDADVGETESTTDLDLSQLQQKEQVKVTTKPISSEVRKTYRSISRQPAGDDSTTLSFMQPIDLKKIRQRVEEERRREKSKAASGFEPHRSPSAANDDLSETSIAASGLEPYRSPSAADRRRHQSKQTSSTKAASGLEPDSSPSAADAGASHDDAMQSSGSAKDLTSTSVKSVKSTGSAGTNTSRTSRVSRKSYASVDYGKYIEAEYGPDYGRRRRSAPEVTSAFILPDITLRVPSDLACECGRPALSANARKLSNELSPHDISKCTVCYRLAAERGKSDLPSFSIPPPRPISDEVDEDADATMRPAMSPQEALAATIKQLEDELKHKKQELLDTVKFLDSHDPRKGSRTRRHAQNRIETLNQEIRTISANVYNLMDVLEGQKAAGQLHDEEEHTGNTTFSGLSDR